MSREVRRHAQASILGSRLPLDPCSFPQTLASIAVDDVNDDIAYLLKHELSFRGDAARALTAKAGMSVEEMASVLAASVRPIGRSCSMFGAWGSRTVDGQLYTGRNLDWVRLDTPRCDRVAVWRACLPR